MNQKFKATLITLVTSFTIVGCSPSEETKTNTKATDGAKEISRAPYLEPGITYQYIKDGSCKESEKVVCLTPEAYEQACTWSQGMTKSAANGLAMGDQLAFNLFRGGFVETSKVYWNPAGPIYKCRAKLVVQGDYQGSSRRKELDGAALFFIATQDGEILVSYADGNSP